MTTIILSKSESLKQGTLLARGDITAMTSSVRILVTEANRDYLRAVRQAELEAWRNAPGGTKCMNRNGS